MKLHYLLIVFQVAAFASFAIGTAAAALVSDLLGAAINRPMMLMICASLSIVYLFFYAFEERIKEEILAISVFYFFVSMFFATAGVFRQLDFDDFSLAFGLFVAVLFSFFNKDIVRACVLVLFLIHFGIQMYEVVNQSFFFVANVQGVSIDERLIGGAVGVFRAKGIFEGPLSAALFVILITFWFTNKPVILILLVASGVATGGRAPFLFFITFIVLMALLSRDFQRMLLERVVLIAALVVALSAFVSVWLGDLVIERLQTLFTLETTADSARLFFMERGIELFSTYEGVAVLLGYPRSSYAAFNNSAENAFIQMALDYGLVGLLLLIATLAICIFSRYVSAASRVYFLAICPILFSVSGISTVFSSALFFFAAITVLRSHYELKQKPAMA